MLFHKETLDVRIKQIISHHQDILKHKTLTLETLNPENVVKRGYSMTLDDKGQPITSLKNVKKGQHIKTYIKDGIINSEVLEVEGNINGTKL